MKKKFINDDQLPFPEGYAAGIVLDGLHEGESQDGALKTKFLLGGGFVSALIEILRSEKILNSIKMAN